ncbi:hypothetical protein, partial [Thauera aminoaromatica]|uniref:hypothetical protein n=1 Tax=Thauera aminoaromatica TaxID=164330 RepID=UPI0035B4B344
MKPTIIFRHPDGLGEIIADPENGCLWVSRPAHSEHPIRASRTPGVPEETTMAYKENGSAAMTDTSLVRARGVRGRCGA